MKIRNSLCSWDNLWNGHYNKQRRTIIIIALLVILFNPIFSSKIISFIIDSISLISSYALLGDLKSRINSPETNPKKLNCSRKEEIKKFLSDFILKSSSAVVVTHSASWFDESMANKVKNEKELTLFIYLYKINEELESRLRSCSNIEYKKLKYPPHARFTLLNPDHSPRRELAIASGTETNHEITIFDCKSGEEIISLAKDIADANKND